MNMDKVGERMEGVEGAFKCPLTLTKITISEKRNRTKAALTKLPTSELERQQLCPTGVTLGSGGQFSTKSWILIAASPCPGHPGVNFFCWPRVLT